MLQRYLVRVLVHRYRSRTRVVLEPDLRLGPVHRYRPNTIPPPRTASSPARSAGPTTPRDPRDPRERVVAMLSANPFSTRSPAWARRAFTTGAARLQGSGAAWPVTPGELRASLETAWLEPHRKLPRRRRARALPRRDAVMVRLGERPRLDYARRHIAARRR